VVLFFLEKAKGVARAIPDALGSQATHWPQNRSQNPSWWRMPMGIRGGLALTDVHDNLETDRERLEVGIIGPQAYSVIRSPAFIAPS
jgi:sirohydrochlorin ferrochelatase